MIEMVSLVLAVLAMVVALWHLIEIRTVARSLSTRYIGQLPDYFPEIVALLKRARHDIVIFCDFPAYGSFTEHDSWFDYRQILERKIQEGRRVVLTCLDEDCRNKYVKQQLFKEGQGWDEWKQSSGINKQLQHYLKKHPEAPNIDELKEGDLLKLFADEERQMLQELSGAEIQQISTYMPLYFWLVDGSSAIFVVPSYSERAIDYGFFTTDQKLILAFEGMRDRYHLQK